MNGKIRILFVEDCAIDAELITNRLVQDGYEVEMGLVDNPVDMRNILMDKHWDVILCDYSMPGFNPYEAMKILKELNLDIPFIVISGTVGEHNVVKLMKAGCHDCVMKENIIRLPSIINREIDEAKIRADNRKLKERMQKYKILAETSNDAMLFIDKEGNIIEANDAALRIYGYTAEEFLSMSIFDLRRLKKAPYLMKQMEVADKEGIIFETIHYRKNDQLIHVEVSSKGTLLGNKRVLLSIVRDISDRKKAEKEIMIALKKAEAANAAKSQFLANMSHEIRTPMNGIIGMTDLTLMTDLQEEQREYLTIVKSSTMLLLRVLNDILDYSKIEAGKIDLEKSSFDINDTINEVIDLFDIVAKQKGLCIKFMIDPTIPPHIVGDTVRIRQVLSNLVGNAIKFTSQGEIVISVNLQEQYENTVKLMFIVKDTGIGIAEDKLDKLFKRFSQVDDSNTRQFGGTGLGLAISKKLIEIMGGEIGVESKEDVGSSFFFNAVFELSDVHSKYQENFLDSESYRNKNPAPIKVLLAEDDVVSRNIVTIILEKNGFQVIPVENGEDACRAFENDKFDIILMDVNMPYVDGYAATTTIRLKEKSLNFRTPIIAMTAYALKGDREKCLEVGMDDYISKPINIEQVLTIIQKHVGINHEVASHEPLPAEPKNSFDEIVFALMEASDFDRDTSEEIVEVFFEQAIRLLTDIRVHIDEANYEHVGLLLHQLKGSAGNVRAVDIANQVLVAEKAMKVKDIDMVETLLEKIGKLVAELMKNNRKGVIR